jgi:predicted acylesterase/phospholipase RssA
MKYLEPFVTALIDNLNKSKIPKQLDVVLEGGALNGAYEAGVMCYLRELEKMKVCEVKRISGVSCGALIATMYLTSTLDSLDHFYSLLTRNLLSSGKFDELPAFLDEALSALTDEKVKALSGRLYITYVDMKTHSRVVVSEFDSKESLKEVLRKSAYIPYIMDGNVTTDDCCIDGGTPYIFPFDVDKRKDNSYRTLYIKLASWRLMKEALSTKSNYNVARRATEGIQRIHDLLCEGKSNELASFVEDWTLKEFSITSLSRVVWYVFIIVVRVLMNIADYMPEQVLQSPFYRRFVGICGELWSDYGHRLVS